MSEKKKENKLEQKNDPAKQPIEETQIKKSINTALRIGFIALLFVMSYFIIKPFLGIILWAIIIAVALFPLQKRFSRILGNREKLSITLIVIFGISLIVFPSVLFTASTVQSLQDLSHSLTEGSLTVPQPDKSVAEWPLIGKLVFETWELASKSLSALVLKFAPQLMEFAPSILSFATGLLGSVFIFIISLIIAGALLANAKAAEKTSVSVFKTLAGTEGEHFASLAGDTIRGVVQGVLGTAVLQAFFISIGLFSVGFPAAGLVSLIVLFVAIIQLPVLLIMIPAIIYVFSYADTTAAVIFTIWSVLWAVADNFIKPVLMGRGVDIPMLIILLGAIGGMMLGGIIGLFIGAVILAFAYKVFQAIVLAD